jgi:hypothetical protein
MATNPAAPRTAPAAHGPSTPAPTAGTTDRRTADRAAPRPPRTRRRCEKVRRGSRSRSEIPGPPRVVRRVADRTHPTQPGATHSPAHRASRETRQRTTATTCPSNRPRCRAGRAPAPAPRSGPAPRSPRARDTANEPCARPRSRPRRSPRPGGRPAHRHRSARGNRPAARPRDRLFQRGANQSATSLSRIGRSACNCSRSSALRRES